MCLILVFGVGSHDDVGEIGSALARRRYETALLIVRLEVL